MLAAPSARQDAIRQAREAVALKPVYLDTETTGLETTDQIVDICILDHAGQVLVNSLVKPTGPIPAGTTRIHGITDEMVKNSPTWAEIWPEVESALAERAVAIYNAEYDVRMMRQSHRQRRLRWQLPEAGFFCIMRLYAQFHGEWDS